MHISEQMTLLGDSLHRRHARPTVVHNPVPDRHGGSHCVEILSTHLRLRSKIDRNRRIGFGGGGPPGAEATGRPAERSRPITVGG